ncbi:MAG: tetratricopeptide repeat protein, partial [Methyloceanibacter sp.]
KQTRPYAEQGDPEAQFMLGRMYQEGRGVIQDHAEAVKWYRLSADKGQPFAQNNLGVMYKNGWGVKQD